MKKILTMIMVLGSTYSFSAHAESELKIHDKGAIIDFGNAFDLSVASTGADKRSALSQDTDTASVTPGNETELGLSYDRPINEKLNTNFKVSYRNDVNNNLGASDGAAILRFNYKLN